MATTRQARHAKAARRPALEPLERRALLSGAAARFDPASSVFVRFEAGVSAWQSASALKAVGGRVVTAYPDGPELVALPAGVSRAAAVRALRVEPGVVYAEADGTFHATGVPATPSRPLNPNDPKLLSEWGMGMIDAPYAWAVTTGTPATIVAVLDTGIDLANPEFAGRIWTNPSANNDGHKGDLHGWNFVANTGNVADNNGHGTHVSGILAAAGNNGVGIAGVDWGTQIMPLKILDSQGNGSTDSAVSAVYFAVAHGARVINASWGGDTFSQAMLDALNYANGKGVVFVTAAGNDAVSDDSALSDPQNGTTYPASYHTPNELVVAGVDPSGTLASWSNFGAKTVDLAAPGVGIVSTVLGGYATYDGTSMATPFVSGAVALLAGMNPGMTADQLAARVRATVKPFPQLNGLLISPGVVDPLNALLNRQPLKTAPPGPTTTGRPSAPPPPPPSALVPGGSTVSAVENGLLSTDSVYALFGGTASSYVAGVYQAVDGRAATADEVAYYAPSIQAGASARADLVGKLQNSNEGRLTRVARWYVDELGSTALLSDLESDPGVMSYANLLAGGTGVSAAQGTLFGKVAAGAGASIATPVWVVTTLYRGLLGRAPDPGGLAVFTSTLNVGAPVSQVARQILTSSEGRLVTVANLYRDDLGSSAGLPDLAADAGVAYWASLLGGD